jgi:hypothetical protein
MTKHLFTSVVGVFKTTILAEKTVRQFKINGLDTKMLSILGRNQGADKQAEGFTGAIEVATVLGGLNALGAALFSMGIQRDRIAHYESVIMRGWVVLIFRGTAVEVEAAREILKLANAAGAGLNVRGLAANA